MRKILTPLMQSLPRSLTRPLVKPVARSLARPVLAACLATALGGSVLGLAVGLAPVPAQAQGLFSPAITVNGDAITGYELEQRARLLQILNAPGDTAELARDGLIEDRLKLQAARAVDMVPTPEDVTAGIDEMAKRANLGTDEFLQTLASGGVDRQTVRDFVSAALVWRDYIGAKFGARARPTPVEIDRALGRANGNGGLQVLLSEIILPVTPQTLAETEALAQQIAQLPTYEAFSAAAAQYSASNSRANGGRLDWLSLSRLPAPMQPVVMGLSKGEITSPLMLPNAIALFQMRGIREAGDTAPRYAKIDYAAYYIPGGRSPEALATAARIKADTDTCNDLYGIAKDQPVEVLDRESRAPGQIPSDIALELAKLDPGESSIALTRNNGQTLVFLMLCGRTSDVAADASREQVANVLIEQRLGSFAQSHLAQLKADALIVEK